LHSLSLERPERVTRDDDLGTVITLHSLSFGYRFYILDQGLARPYVPVGAGPVVATGPALGRSLFGLHAMAGLGLDLHVGDWVRLGLDMRYFYYVTETERDLGLVRYAATEDVAESAFMDLHVVAISGHIGVQLPEQRSETSDEWDIRVEVCPGVGVPLGRYLDGVPRFREGGATMQYWTDNETRHGPWGEDVTLKSDIDSSYVGFNVSASVLLQNVEFRYQLQMLGWRGETVTDVAFHRVSEMLYLPVDSVKGLEASDRPVALLPAVDDDLGRLYIHGVGLGYRFQLMEGEFEPFIPLLLGFTWAHCRAFDAVYGGFAQMGLGFDWQHSEHLYLGLEMRYSWIVTQTPGPELYQASYVEMVAAATSKNESAFEGFVEDLHLLTFNSRVQVRF